jgi:putative tryptophan/tyrosine transport system substrate-binding protein
MTTRRAFITLLSGAAAWPLVARAQQMGKRPLVAWLGGGSQHEQVAMRNRDAFLQGLREHGHEDGKNIDIIYRWADGDMSRQPKLARELIALNPVVIVSAANSGTIALSQATASIPVVGTLLVDPVTVGLAESHNRPGRNVTGLLLMIDSLPGKQAELLMELIPQATTLGVLVNPANPAHPGVLRNVEDAVRKSSIKIVPVEARTRADLEIAFNTHKPDRVEGLIVLVDPLFFTQAARIISLAAAARLPVIHSFRQHVEQGGLMSYGVDIPQSFRRSAYFVDRILKGAQAGDLPIELPSKLELVINFKSARMLDLEIPSTLLARADEVIE